MKSNDMIKRISTALGVDEKRLKLVYSNVKLYTVLLGPECRQFLEMGIPLIQSLSDKLSELRGEDVNSDNVFGLIKNRHISFDMIKEIFSDMISEGGIFSNNKPEHSNLQKNFIVDLFTEFFKEKNKEYADYFNSEQYKKDADELNKSMEWSKDELEKFRNRFEVKPKLQKILIAKAPESGNPDDADWEEVELHPVHLNGEDQGSIELTDSGDGLPVKTMIDYVINGKVINKGSILRIKF